MKRVVRVVVAATSLVAFQAGVMVSTQALAQSSVGANVNVTVRAGNQLEATVAIDPTNPDRVFVSSNDETVSPAGIFTGRSADGGATWTRGVLGTGAAGDGFAPACCDPSASWDSFGNLFLTYLSTGLTRGVELLVSTDGGATFTNLGPIRTGGNLDQPTVATGSGVVWVTWRESSATGIGASGASVTGLGTIGAFGAPQFAPGSATGNFGDIAIGPGGEVLVTYQVPSGGQGPATISTNLDADGVGAGGFAAAVAATTTNVGGFDFIPAQPDRSIDAEAGLAYDRSGGPNAGRVYLVYTEEAPAESNDTDILVRFSDNDGTTWSAPVQVNDDVGTNSQFFPRIAVDQTSGDVGVTFHDSRNDLAGDPDGANNDAQFFGSRSVDGGLTFEANFRISAGTSDEDGAEPPAACCADLDYGDYTGLDFFQGILRPVWADNSNSTADNPDGTLTRYDVYTAEVSFPEILIADVSLNEGNGGTTAFAFTVTLSNPATGTVTVDFATADGMATTADNDYLGATGTVTFAPGDTSETVTITVNGDTTFEPDETFFVNLSNAQNAAIADGQGQGTIVNDDDKPTVSIGDATVDEGNFGTTSLPFAVSLSNASFEAITVDFATVDGTATTADNDYLSATGTVTFAPGDTSETVTVTVNGDTKIEPDESIVVSLSISTPQNATIADGQGLGTILNDDLSFDDDDCTITGTSRDDVLVGTPGDDVICGRGGDDEIRGMGGHDILVGGSGKDMLIGGDGNDLLLGGAGKDDLQGEGGNDNLQGGNGADTLVGGPGSDALFGRNGPDSLNTQDGIGGNDSANGGLGTDVCAVDPGDATVSC